MGWLEFGGLHGTFFYLNFIFRDSLNHRFSYHPVPNTVQQIANKLLFQVSTRSFLCTWPTPFNIGVTWKCISHRGYMSRLARALRTLLSHSREKQKMPLVLLCCCYALVNKKAPICISCKVKSLWVKRNDKLNSKLQNTLFRCKSLTILTA